ncbi:hypothetical protein BC833DRAFT_647886 [Globomyces pollinis-pini]|nr:hypothetical protein BC833DRAFT_647886 [Globomyces pollinis-pini]
MTIKQRRIFFGLPGAGKSTLFNMIFGEATFHAHGKFKKNGITYVECPRIDSVADLNKFSNETAEYVRKGGFFQLFFVVTLEKGKFNPVTWKVVHSIVDAIGDKNVPVSVILNKVSPSTYRAMKDEETRRTFEDRILEGEGLNVTNIYYYIRQEGLFDEEEVRVGKLQDGFEEFLNTAIGFETVPYE